MLNCKNLLVDDKLNTNSSKKYKSSTIPVVDALASLASSAGSTGLNGPVGGTILPNDRLG